MNNAIYVNYQIL